MKQALFLRIAIFKADINFLMFSHLWSNEVGKLVPLLAAKSTFQFYVCPLWINNIETALENGFWIVLSKSTNCIPH